MKTVLCVPGHDERKLARCRDFGADLILFDLEDSVPAAHKEKARDLVAEHVRPGDAVRIEEATGAAARLWAGTGATLWLPKLGLNAAKGSRDIAAEAGLPVVPIIELPSALLGLPSFGVWCFDDPEGWLAGLAFGRADFMAATGASIGSPLVDRAQEMVALAAHGVGVPCYDSPCEERDHRAATWEATRAAVCCYTAKGCVYPEHVALVRAACEIADVDLERARRIVALAEATGGELFEDLGAVVAPPHVKAAKELLRVHG